MTNQNQSILLGGGCFWCTEAVYARVKGVLEVESGYANSFIEYTSKPTYEEVCTGDTGFNEVVKLIFDPTLVSLGELLEIFFVIHDPTTLNQQGADRGTQYRSGIYFYETEQGEEAKELITTIQSSGILQRPVVTEVLPVRNYWPAEDYHQDFFEKNPTQGYCMAVALPKVSKFLKTFGHLQKS